MNLDIINYIVISILLLAVSCGKDNEPKNPDYEQTVKEGMEMYTRAYRDGVLVEEVIDEVKNFGTPDAPLLFHVNKSHTVNGQDVPQGTSDLDGVFLSLTQEEYDGFIKLFAVMQGLAETELLTDEQKREAFSALFAYLQQYDIDLPLLVYLANGSAEELKATDKIIRAESTRSIDGNSDINTRLRNLLLNNIKPSYAISLSDKENSTRAFEFNPCRLVVDGTVYDTDQKFRLVHDAKKVSDYERLYASFININNLDLKQYYGSSEWNGNDYECTYGSKLTPMSHIKFHVVTDYLTKCKTQPGRYVEKVKVEIDEASRTAWMKCDAHVLYAAPTTYDYATASGSYAPHSHLNKIEISYGDKSCINFKSTLAFDVYGFDGYHERFWQK